MRIEKTGGKERQKTQREIANEQYESQRLRELGSIRKGKLSKEELTARNVE